MSGEWYGFYDKDGMNLRVRMLAYGIWGYQAFLTDLSDHGTVEATNRVEAWERAFEAARFDQHR